MADEQLTIRARLGQALAAVDQPASVEVVYVRHYRAVYRYVLALSRSTEEAEDISAETFERAVRAWDSKPPARGSELPWL
ncbi:MAG: hypothetical protein M3N29_00030, partial [Chloroflexota bacterium]|nr:hypothetical protein [Chloroflexota bacterium]